MEALHDVLCDVIKEFLPEEELSEEFPDSHCYFQPPANIQLKYPCIIYHYTNDDDDFADNLHYRRFKRYTITIIDEETDSKIPDKLVEVLPYCISDRNFDSDGLSHFIFTLFHNGPRIKEVNIDG